MARGLSGSLERGGPGLTKGRLADTWGVEGGSRGLACAATMQKGACSWLDVDCSLAASRHQEGFTSPVSGLLFVSDVQQRARI